MGFFVLLISICMLVGCAMPYSSGLIFSNMDRPACSPDDATGLQIGSKAGTSQMVNYLGLIAIGDASIKTAAKNGGITRISSVDLKHTSILGIVVSYETIVSGE